MMRIYLICVLAFYVARLSSAACLFPPSVWCSSAEIAESCQVSDQCKTWLPQSINTEMAAPKVNFSMYYEALCGGCINMFIDQVTPTYQAIPEIMNLYLIPYGNAEETKQGKKWVFECQHGEDECRGNMLETCTLHVLKGMSKAFPLISCAEALGFQMIPADAFVQCSKQLKIDLTKIYKCANGTLGNHLEHLMAKKTDALQPSHQYVPWVTLNGIHTETIQNEAMSDLLKLICETYTGPKPSGCTEAYKRTDVCMKE